MQQLSVVRLGMVFATNSGKAERVIGLTNKIKNKFRSRLLDGTLNAILHINLDSIDPADIEIYRIARQLREEAARK